MSDFTKHQDRGLSTPERKCTALHGAEVVLSSKEPLSVGAQKLHQAERTRILRQFRTKLNEGKRVKMSEQEDNG